MPSLSSCVAKSGAEAELLSLIDRYAALLFLLSQF